MTLTIGSELSRISTDRAAVVPYIFKNGVLYFLLGVDSQYGELTDFGGGVKGGIRKETSLAAALREFREESDEVFGDIYFDVNDTATKVAVLEDRMCTLFLPLEKRWHIDAPKLFEERRDDPERRRTRKKSHKEVKELLWFTEDEFSRLLRPRNDKMWGRIKNFYRRNYNDNLRWALKIVYDKP